MNFLKSSANSAKLSLTLKSFIPLVLAVASITGTVIPEDMINEAIESLVALFSAVFFLYGLGRKVYYKFK